MSDAETDDRPNAHSGGREPEAGQEDPTQTVDRSRVARIGPESDRLRELRQLASGRFEEIEPIGRGGMATVYLAFDRKLHRPVALKVLEASSPKSEHDWLHEARAQARVNHENICRVYEVYATETAGVIVMQYIDGAALSTMRGDLPIAERIQIMIRVARAVHAAHRQGLIHQDLKPSNIMLEFQPDDSSKPHVVDFGIAITRSDAEHLGEGSPPFMAPEQVDGAEVDARTDVYGLGATLFALLSGSHPVTLRGRDDWREVVRSQPRRSLSRVEPLVPRELDCIVTKCLALDPAKRYQTAEDLAADLSRYARGEPIGLLRSSPTYRLGRLIRSHPRLFMAGAAILAAAAIANQIAVHRERSATIAVLRIERLTERISANLRHARMLRRHTRHHDRRTTDRQVKLLTQEVEGLTGAARGAGHHAVGRVHYQLGDTDAAVEAFVEAGERGYASPGLDWSLGLALARNSRRRWDAAGASASRPPGHARSIDSVASCRPPRSSTWFGGARARSAPRGSRMRCSPFTRGARRRPCAPPKTPSTRHHGCTRPSWWWETSGRPEATGISSKARSTRRPGRSNMRSRPTVKRRAWPRAKRLATSVNATCTESGSTWRSTSRSGTRARRTDTARRPARTPSTSTRR